MTEPTRRLAELTFPGQTRERERIRRLVFRYLAERMSALARFVVCLAHNTIMPDGCRRDVIASTVAIRAPAPLDRATCSPADGSQTSLAEGETIFGTELRGDLPVLTVWML
jgi:hypothetical protein